jgi:hypothetical protein
MKGLAEEVRVCSEHGEEVSINEGDFLPNQTGSTPFAKASYVGCCDAAIDSVICGIIALAITGEAFLQGSYIATTLERDLDGLTFDPFRYHFILEFLLAKLAVLSVKSESLENRSIADALVREIDSLVTHRCTFEPNARVAFGHYQNLARDLNEAARALSLELGNLFMKRYAQITANLPEANVPTKRRLSEEDLAVSSSVVGDYCWPLRNETEAKVFGSH